jgi:hypothetical protein
MLIPTLNKRLEEAADVSSWRVPINLLQARNNQNGLSSAALTTDSFAIQGEANMYLRSLCALALLLPGLCNADSTLTYKNEANTGGETIIQVKDGDVLMGDRNSKMLVKNGKQEIVIIDHPSKSFMVMDEAAAKRMEQQVSAAKQQMSAMMQQMQKQMENMSEEQRAQMQALMGSRMPSAMASTPVKTTVKKQGEETVAGVTCTKLLVLVNDKPSGDVCVARAGVLGLENKDYDSMVHATDAVRKIMTQVTGMQNNDTVSMDLRAMKGIPVRMRDLVDGDISVLKSRSSAELDAGIFRVPEGYQKRDMFQ